MKRSFKIWVLFLLGVSIISSSHLFSQNTSSGVSGIYMNATDYNKGNVSLSFDCKSPGKIKLHHLFAAKHIDVIEGGKKIRLNKDSIFGYHTCKNEDYRFYKTYDEEFRILENKGIIIYMSYVNVSPYNVKAIHLVPAYFFSTTINSEILPLTLINLKRAFPGNIKFHDMLDTEFAGGKPLSAYSSTDKMYEVNLLFNQSNLK